ncbi:Hint domain-containing protein [Paracoccaceae bacterium Fryx2]|nr:Hint domain-containing protein [Paracoccaceae bacterium Fryx2]
MPRADALKILDAAAPGKGEAADGLSPIRAADAAPDGTVSATDGDVGPAVAGDERVLAGAGDDSVEGGSGDDTLAGGAGADALFGGAGDDLLLAAGDPADLIGNGGFEQTGGMAATGTGHLGYDGTAPGGWVAGPGGVVEIVSAGAGGNSLDTEGPFGTGSISQQIAGVVDGAPYEITFDAIDGLSDDNTLDVFWNGILVGTVDPGSAAHTTYRIAVTGGEGDGSNTLTFQSTGPQDGAGMLLDNVQFWGAGSLTDDADADTLSGGDGRDAVVAAGGDLVDGGDDADTLVVNGVLSIAFDPDNAENGTITFIDASILTFANIEAMVVDGGADDIVRGTAGDDLIGAGHADLDGDRIDGNDALLPGEGANDDIVLAGGGNDTVAGGLGADEVFGGAGNDSLNGEDGDDSLLGGTGDDTLIGGGGDDTLRGGDGRDLLLGVDGADLMFGEVGDDELVGSVGDDTLHGGAGNDTLRGDEGNDTLYGGDDADRLYAGSGAGFVDGGEGGDDDDTLNVSDLAGVVHDPANGENGTVTFLDGSTLGFVNIEHLVFNGGPDGIIYGTDRADLIDAAYVDRNGDRVDAGDAVFAGAGPDDDEVFAGGGDDTILSGAGRDYVYGGDDRDRIATGDGDDYAQGDAGDDTVLGEDGDDFLRGDAGNDIVQGDGGSDTVYGGLGEDTIFGGIGNDYAYGGYGNDFVYGGDGADTITGSDGDDVVHGGAGDDQVLGSNGNDTLYGGAGRDALFGDFDRDVIHGEAGDTVDGGKGGDDFDTLHVADVAAIDYDPANGENGTVTFNDGGTLGFFGIESTVIDRAASRNGVVSGTAGDDLIDTAYSDDPEGDRIDAADALPGAGPDDDLVKAGDGHDTVLAGAGADQVFGGTGNDSLSGEGGNDLLHGEDGNDHLSGGAGDDERFGGAGNDTLTGDAGADRMQGGDDRDTFFDGPGDTIDGNEGGDDFDTLDLRAWGKAGTTIRFDPLNGENGSVECLDADGAVTGTIAFSNIEQAVPCFTPGSLILTERGEVRVEALVAGNTVVTRDNGHQPVRWTGRRDLARADLMAQPRLSPVRIAARALDGILPQRDMLVSPQHRMLMTGPRAEMFFGEPEVLVAATHLVGEAGIDRVFPDGISYIHILFDRHEIISADGAWTESFQPGDLTLAGMDGEQRAEVLAIFPELAEPGSRFAAARLTLKPHEVKVMLSD